MAILTAVAYLDANFANPEVLRKAKEEAFTEKMTTAEKCIKCDKRENCIQSNKLKFKNEMLAAIEFKLAIDKYIKALGIDREDADNGSEGKE